MSSSYKKFMVWMKNKKINEKCISEAIMPVYFKSSKGKCISDRHTKIPAT